KPNGRELRVGSQTGEDHRLVGIELVRHRRAPLVTNWLSVQVALQLAAPDPAVDRVAADSELSGQGALGDALFQVVPEQHSLLSSDQARLQQRRGGAKVTESLRARSARAPASYQVSDFQPPKVSDLQPPATPVMTRSRDRRS